MSNNNREKSNKIKCSCGCATGRIREKNEDNFFFAGRHLSSKNDGLKSPLTKTIRTRKDNKLGALFTVFDGIGGGQFGELAAYEAAKCTKKYMKTAEEESLSKGRILLADLCKTINEEVYKVGENLGASFVGTTIAALYFYNDVAWACNVGDSRCYRLRDGVLEMLSEDHVEELFKIDMINKKRKPRLIQYIGMDPNEILIEPTINFSDVVEGDIYLLCTDGLTDMVTEADITSILCKSESPENAVDKLIEVALDNGGKDNVSVIVCYC